MNKYIVNIFHEYGQLNTFKLVANNEEDAKEKAINLCFGDAGKILDIDIRQLP